MTTTTTTTTTTKTKTGTRKKVSSRDRWVTRGVCKNLPWTRPCDQGELVFCSSAQRWKREREPYTRETPRGDLTERIQIQSWATTTTTTTRRAHRATRPTRNSPLAFLWNRGRRCCLLDVSTSVCGSERPRTGLLSSESPNQKTGSTPYADWSTTATVNTVIGQSVRVTHGYRLPQQYLRSISPPWLPCRRALPFLPYACRCRLFAHPPTHPLCPFSRTHAAISAYNLEPEYSRATASSSSSSSSSCPPPFP